MGTPDLPVSAVVSFRRFRVQRKPPIQITHAESPTGITHLVDVAWCAKWLNGAIRYRHSDSPTAASGQQYVTRNKT